MKERNLSTFPAISQKEISVEISMDINTVKYYMKKLKKIGILEREGNARSGKWLVNIPQMYQKK